MKSGKGQATVDPFYLSGTKSAVLDLRGNVFDVNYCRQMQQSRLCSSAPSCSTKCPLGYKTDVHGCVASCDCKTLGHGDTVLVSFQRFDLSVTAVIVGPLSIDIKSFHSLVIL